jgi:hypothetical protein
MPINYVVAAVDNVAVPVAIFGAVSWKIVKWKRGSRLAKNTRVLVLLVLRLLALVGGLWVGSGWAADLGASCLLC